MTQLREGFTTGSCAAARALAPYRCAVRKDSGDDPDITNGSEVWAEIHLLEGAGPVSFRAGEGVGTVTRTGLKLPVGEAAINPVPRKMIEAAVRSVYPGRAVQVTVGITGGREMAVRTFNPRLGIKGGLSVLGTTGVVRPMSEAALTETILLEMNVRRADGARMLGLTFGSQGEAALQALKPGLPCVQISNFVGFALDTAAELGFSSVLLAGQPGKMVKVAGGCMQTHSKYGDGRREALCAHLALMRAPLQLLEVVMRSNTLDGLIPLISESGYSAVWTRLSAAAAACCEARTHGVLHVDTMMMDSAGRVLGASEGSGVEI